MPNDLKFTVAVIGIYALAMVCIWLWPSRNYPADNMLTELFRTFALTDFTVVKNGQYELHLRGPMGDIRCWNANRWYAWASSGTFTPADAKEASILWKDRMPAWRALRAMRLAVEAVEIKRFKAAERGDVVIDLSDYAVAGYAVRRITDGVTETSDEAQQARNRNQHG